MKKKIVFLLSENFPFLVVKFSVYLNRRVFVMRNTVAVYRSEIIRKTGSMKYDVEKSWCNIRKNISKCPLQNVLPSMLSVRCKYQSSPWSEHSQTINSKILNAKELSET